MKKTQYSCPLSEATEYQTVVSNVLHHDATYHEAVLATGLQVMHYQNQKNKNKYPLVVVEAHINQMKIEKNAIDAKH